MTDFITVRSKRIEIRWITPSLEDKPCLVFLHEGLGCTAMWKDFPVLVSRETGCPALVFSRFGYGRSDPSPLPWKLNYMHREALCILPDVLAAASIKDYILIGHSDGGSIGIIFSGSPHATGLRGLITEAAHVFCEQISVDNIYRAKINYEQGPLRRALEKYHGENTENAFRGWNDVWLNPRFMHWNIEKYLKHIRVPMLAIQGSDDQYGTLRQLEAIEAKVGNVVTRRIAHCKHSPHFEQPDIVLDHMVRFIREIS